MRPLLLTLFMLLTGLGGVVSAEPVVVVSTASTIHQLSQDEAINIFLGRYRSLPGGGTALPVDQPESSPLRAEFYHRLVNKNLNEINAYWSRLLFSGRISPPQQAANAAEVILIVSRNPDSIGYVERGQVDKRLRIVLEFPR